MPNALIIGGSGQIGVATASKLVDEGWNVVVGSRHKPDISADWRHAVIDSNHPSSLPQALGNGCDLLVSCIAFDASDARRIMECQSMIGHIVAISSASVYKDSLGRTLDEAAENGFPEFHGALTEHTTTVEPGSETYSTRKVAMERELLLNASVPVTILRPCAIHGPYSKHAREWWFVKRLLDKRARIPLAYGGKSQFQTTSTDAIAEAIIQAFDGKLPSITNVMDSDSPSVEEIGHAIMNTMNMEAELVRLPEEQYPATMGVTPWSTPNPFVCQSFAKSEKTYAQSVPPAVQWLVESAQSKNWKNLLPQLASYPREHFDYSNDDEALRTASKLV